MSRQFLLFRLSFKRVWKLLFATGFLLAGFQVLRVHIAASVHQAGDFEEIAALLPPAVRAILGPSLTSVMSFNGIVCGGYFDLGNVLALVGLSIALATLPASEIETGFADLMLSRPIPRHWLITRDDRPRGLSRSCSCSWRSWRAPGPAWPCSLLPDNPGPPAHQIAALASNLGMLLLCWGGVAMAFGAGCRRGAAAAITSLLAFRHFAPGLRSKTVAATGVDRLDFALQIQHPV